MLRCSICLTQRPVARKAQRMVKRIRTTAWSRLMASGMRALTAGALRQLKAATKPRRAKKAATAKPGHQAVKRPP